MQENWVQSLGRENPLEKGMATHTGILAWRISWIEESGRLPSMGRKEADMTELSRNFHFQGTKHWNVRFPRWHRAQNPPANAGDARDFSSVSLWKLGSPLPDSCHVIIQYKLKFEHVSCLPHMPSLGTSTLWKVVTWIWCLYMFVLLWLLRSKKTSLITLSRE